MYSTSRKLDKTVRLNLHAEKVKVCEYIRGKLDMRDMVLDDSKVKDFVTLEEYQKHRSGFHYCCFVLGLMSYV